MLSSITQAAAQVAKNRQPDASEKLAPAPAPADAVKAAPRLADDAEVHRAIQAQPEQREAVYTRLVRAEPALIHHLENWRRQEEAPVLVDAPAEPARLRELLGEPQPLAPATGPALAAPLDAAGAVPAATPSLTPAVTPPTLQATVAAWVEAAVPAARTLVSHALARGGQMVQGMVRALASAEEAAAVAKATQAVLAEDLPEQRAVELSRQAADIEARFGREAAVEFVARVVETDPAGFAEGMTRATYGSLWQNDPAVQRMLAAGIDRAHQRAPGGAEGQKAFAALLVEGMQAGQGGHALSEVANLVGLTGNDTLQVQFVEAGLEKAHALATQAGTWHVGADKLVASLAPAVRGSPAAVQAVIDKTQQLALGSYADDMHAAGTDALNWTLRQFAQSGVADGQGGYVNGLSMFLDTAAPADAPPYPGAPFTVAQMPLSSAQSFALFNAMAGDAELLQFGDPQAASAGVDVAAQLFEQYMPKWIADGRIAGTATGTLDDKFDATLQTFMDHALFNPDTDGPYRQHLMGAVVGLLGGLSNGTVAPGMSAEARGRLAGGLVALIDQGFDQHADSIRADGAARQAWANFAVGLGFAFVPGAPGAVAKVLVGQGVGQAKSVVTDTITQLIQAGVRADIAQAAAEAANRGELMTAFETLGLEPEAMAKIAEYIDRQQNSLSQGSKTLGELMLDMLADNTVWTNEDFVDGVGDGWQQVQNRE
jgi:hypothetical protein